MELGLASYEIDLFGRVRNLGESALQNFFAVEANRRSTQISLVAEIAIAWLTLAADTERLALARDTLQSQQASFVLTRRTRELGGTSGLVLARADHGGSGARRAGAPHPRGGAGPAGAGTVASTRLADALLPAVPPVDTANAANAYAEASLLADVPAGLPSQVLQPRPDVAAAEHLLRAANADIGVARAALFPSIRLTATAGSQSPSLSGLFGNYSGAWRFVPQIDPPIFDAGRRRGNVQLSETKQAIAVANYERTLQMAFREVADALAERGTLAEQLTAQRALTEATQRSLALSDALFRNGGSSYLEVLDAQRSLYPAQQASISLRLSEQTNRVALYRALGGGFDATATGVSVAATDGHESGQP